MCIYIIHWTTNFNFFLDTRRKISVSNKTLNAEFKYVSSFFHHKLFFVTAKLIVRKCENMCISNFTGQQNLTFFWHTGNIYVPTRTFNTKLKYVSSFSQSPTGFCDSQVKCAVLERHTIRLSKMPSAMNRRLSHSLPASEHIQPVI
jgi:hypothetical protein